MTVTIIYRYRKEMTVTIICRYRKDMTVTINCRYRKEMTGDMSTEGLYKIKEQIQRLENLG